MKKSLLDKLCCPMDKGALRHRIFKMEGEEDIKEGLLHCPQCDRYYPIIYGLPIMTPDAYRESALEVPLLKKWGLWIDDSSPDKDTTDKLDNPDDWDG